MIAFFYDLLLILPFSAILTLMLRPYFWGLHTVIPVLLVCAVSVVLLLLLRHLKNHGRIWLAGILATVFLAFLLLQPAEERADFLAAQTWAAEIFLLSLGCCLLHLLPEKYRLLRLLTVLGGAIALTVMAFFGFWIEHAVVGFFLLYLILTLTNEVQHRSVKEGDTDPKKHLVCTSPFWLLLFVGLLLMKAPKEPYRWGFVRTMIDHAQALFAGNPWDSGPPQIGFTDRGDLAGSFGKGDYTALTADLRSPGDAQLYLGGIHFDTFDGQQWSKNDVSTADQQALDTLETMSAILDFEEIQAFEDLMHRSSLHLSYEGLRSARIFTLPKTDPAKGVYDLDLSQRGGDLETASGKAAKQSYDIVYFPMNRGHAIFAHLANTPHTVTPESWNAALEQCKLADPTQYRYEDYLAYHNAIREQYLPDTPISSELQAFLDPWMAGAETDYEKLLRIEKLLQSFTYSDHPGALPSDSDSAADYLDYFILQKQEGFCSHYATAFVLLARAYGIPARYVQGYRVPVGALSFVHVIIQSSYAHAWPEAYLDGIGWISFEPTPGMNLVARWSTTEEKERRAEELAMAEEEADSYRAPETHSASENAAPATPEEEPAGPSVRWYHIVLPITAGLLLALLLFGIDRLVGRIRYNKMTTREKAMWLCKRNLELLKRMKMARPESETIEEFATRAEESFSSEDLAFCAIYEKMIYGGMEPAAEELELLINNRKALQQLRRQRMTAFLHRARK